MKTKVAIAQMTSTDDKKKNIAFCERLIEEAHDKGAKILAFPENFAYFGQNGFDTLKAAEDIDGETVTSLQESAAKYRIWLFLGGMQERIPKEDKIFNSHIVIDDKGEIKAIYRKIHLFQAQVGNNKYDEAKWTNPGVSEVVLETPFFRAGLSICYDLRFPYLFSNMTKIGAQVFFVPAAFTYSTGQYHWEILLRSRAIENQCYVLAPAQVGQHNAMRGTWGHAMIVDPWGTILSQCQEKDNLILSEVDLEYLNEIRRSMPVFFVKP